MSQPEPRRSWKLPLSLGVVVVVLGVGWFEFRHVLTALFEPNLVGLRDTHVPRHRH